MARSPNKHEAGAARALGSRAFECRHVPADSRAHTITVTINARDAEHALRWFSTFYMADLPPGEIRIVDEKGKVVLERSCPREA